jgi:hypothetical protein
MTRGLLVGTDYEARANYRGAWSLYGSFDYIGVARQRVMARQCTGHSHGTCFHRRVLSSMSVNSLVSVRARLVSFTAAHSAIGG